MSRTTTAVCATTILALALAGCGSTKTLTKAQYSVQADAICAKYAAKTAALNPATGTPQAQVDVAIGEVADLIAREVLELRALKPAAAISTDVTAMLAGMASGASTLRQQRSAVLTSGVNAFAAADKKATALGLTKCVF